MFITFPVLYCAFAPLSTPVVPRPSVAASPMFRSKTRPIVIPQYEHGRLAGTLASFWGNAAFDRPAFDFMEFVQGIALHDWHYGLADNVPIGGAAPEQWLALVRQGIARRFPSPVTDIVAKLHIRRLLAMRRAAEHDALIAEIDVVVAERLSSAGMPLESLQWADRITDFCDRVAFDFCFEEPVSKSVPVFARLDDSEPVTLTYAIHPGGGIVAAPWPFSVDSFAGLLIGYEQVRYPDVLSPLLIAFHAERQA